MRSLAPSPASPQQLQSYVNSCWSLTVTGRGSAFSALHTYRAGRSQATLQRWNRNQGACSPSQNSYQGCWGLPYKERGMSLRGGAHARQRCAQSAPGMPGINITPSCAPELVWAGFSAGYCFLATPSSNFVHLDLRWVTGKRFNCLLPRLAVEWGGEHSPSHHWHRMALSDYFHA